jgi:glycosyltransferase involved in cell wall biosynthesis/predicted SAM-dependent methyltransferase
MFGWHESGGGTMFPRTVAEQLSAEGYIISVFYAAGNHAVNHTPYFLEKTLENGVSLYGVYNRPSLFLDTNEPEREICDNIILDLFSEVLDSEQPDLVHFHNFLGLSFAIAELVKLRRIPSLYTPHNYHLIDPKLYLFNSDLSIWESTDFFAESELAFQNEELDISYNKRINSAQNLINNLIDYTFAVSTRQAELLIEFSGQHNNITVVHQASKITDTFQKPATSAQVQIHSPVQIGYIGAVLPHKGLHNLVLASQNLNSEDVEINIFGFVNENYKNELQNIDKINIVKWHGEYKVEDLHEIASKLDFIVVPSVWEDCAPLVISEAFAFGIPVIASNIGGIPDFVKDNFNGRLYQYNSPDELSRILQELVSNPSEILRMKNNINRNFNFSKYISHLTQVYDRLITGENPSADDLALYFSEDSKHKFEKFKADFVPVSNNDSDEEVIFEQNTNIEAPLSEVSHLGLALNKASGIMPFPLPSPLLLNLGCGLDIRKGFINIDLYSDNPEVVYMDVSKLDLPDNSVDFILANDILEHFSHRKTDSVLAEWARVLKPDAEIIIRCPSLKLQMKAYAAGAWNADIASYMIFSGQTNQGDFHCNAFDEHSMRRHLENAGLQIIQFEEIDTPQTSGYINLNMTVHAKKTINSFSNRINIQQIVGQIIDKTKENQSD